MTVLLQLSVGGFSLFTGQTDRRFAGDKCRKAKLIADLSVDEIEVRKINRISSRADSLPAAVAEDAEGLSWADVERAGIPSGAVLEGSAAVGGKTPVRV